MATHTFSASGLMPSLTADDVQKSVDFYVALGFAVKDRYEQDGKLLGAMLASGDVLIGLSQDDFKKGKGRQKGVGMRLYVETRDDIDALATRAQAAGATLTKAPYDTEWKTRAFNATDPDGFLVTISSPEPGR